MPKRRRPPFFFIFAILISVALFFISALLSPKPDIENARPGALGDFDFPTATEGRPLPVLWGSTQTKGANTIWYGALSVWPIREKIPTGLFSSERVTVGFKYFVGFDLALCIGPIDFISRIRIGEKTMLDIDEGDPPITAGGAAGGAEFQITKPEVWGGFKKGGGIEGSFQIYDGIQNQDPDSWLVDFVDQNPPGWGSGAPPGTNLTLPGYNRLCHLVWKQGFIGESTQVRKWQFMMHRYPNPLGLTGDKHIIRPDAENRADANPMNVIYEILIDSDFGLGIPAGSIEIAEFLAAADTLYDEGNGFSMILDNQKKARDVIQEIERQVDGLLFQTSDGRFHFILTRDDYGDGSSLEIFDESNVLEVKSFTRASWDETQNSILVKYTDRTDQYKNTAATAQDMANIQIQGREIKSQLNFPGIKHPDVAADVAARELRQLSFPLARVTLICNREAADLQPGDVIKWSWGRYGIQEMILRVADVDLGSLTNGTIKVGAYQDMFGLGDTVFTGGGPSLNTAVDTSAAPVIVEQITGMPFWFLQNDQDIDETIVGERTLHMAEAPDLVTTAFDVYQEIAASDFQLIGRGNSATPTAELTADYAETLGPLGAVDTVGFTVENVNWGQTPEDVTPASIADFGYGLVFVNGEILAYENVVDNGDGTFDFQRIHRSLLDTVSADHAAGDKVWFFRLGSATAAVDITDATPTFRNISQTVGDTLPIADASDINYTLDQRQERPLRPGYVRVNNQAFPTNLTTTTLTTTWARRGTTQLKVVDDTNADETTGLPDNYIIQYRKRDPLGNLGAVFNEDSFGNSAVTTGGYARATYLSDSGGFQVGDTMHLTLLSRNTSPALDSHSSWVKEFQVTPGGQVTTSTLSLLLNGAAGPPATDQQYIEGPAMTALYASDPTVISWCAWIKFNDVDANFDVLLGASSDYNNWDDGFGLHVSTATTNTCTAWFGHYLSGSGGATAAFDGNLLDGSWHHVAATWDTVTNQTPVVWVDGVSQTLSASSSRSTAVVRGGSFDLGRLGAVNMGATSFVDANYDDVAIYDSVLTQTDVNGIYQGGTAQDLNIYGPTGNLVMWWKCGEDISDDATAGTGQVTDVGGNGNNHNGTPEAAVNDPSFPADVA